MQTSGTFKKLINSKKRIVENRGGSGSSKTYSTLQMYLKWLTSGEMRRDEWVFKGVASVVRQFGSELSKSVLRDWYKILEEEGYSLSSRVEGGNIIKENKTERTFTYQGRIVEFMGCDDPEKVKGPRRQFLYVNEANNVSYKVFMQMLMRTEGLCVIDFNPDDDEVWINKKIEQERMTLIGDVDLIVSTFRDNAFLPKENVKEILNLRLTDPEEWNVYGNGEYGKIKGTIFEEGRNWDTIGEIPESAIFKGYGQDYGFTTDPTVLIGIYQYDKDTIILDEVIWEAGLVNTYKDPEKKLESIVGHYELHDVDKSSEIWADSSEPKSNEEIYDDGYNIEGVKKGPGSILSGLKQMKKYKILITARSLKLRNEFKKYKWKVDRNGNIVKDKDKRPVAEDKNNHGIDAARYGITHIFEDSNSIEEIELTIL